MKKLIVTPEGTQEIELTAEDITQIELDAVKNEADKVIREEKIAQEKVRKESAIAKLKALGLTEEEVKSIL
jgi:fructose-1,6-bisphosphatase/sedoheptulose 1,7-bisphosphatase-like protein